MINKLNSIEKDEHWDRIANPFLDYVIGSIVEKKRVSQGIFLRKTEDILLIDKFGFCIDSIFAGLNEKQIEYFAKNAPAEYKKKMLEIFKDKDMINGVWEIAKAMDSDEGDGLTKHQDRIKRVIQYIQDNRAVFQV